MRYQVNSMIINHLLKLLVESEVFMGKSQAKFLPRRFWEAGRKLPPTINPKFDVFPKKPNVRGPPSAYGRYGRIMLSN